MRKYQWRDLNHCTAGQVIWIGAFWFIVGAAIAGLFYAPMLASINQPPPPAFDSSLVQPFENTAMIPDDTSSGIFVTAGKVTMGVIETDCCHKCECR